MVLGTFIAYLAIYVVLTLAYIGALFHLANKKAKGDDASGKPERTGPDGITVLTPAE
jgi:cytochrome d ubiquinol oxidase subunit I